MEQPQTVVRQGPRTWVVVAITLGAVLGVGIVFVAGLVTGIAVSGTGGGTSVGTGGGTGPGAGPTGGTGGTGGTDASGPGDVDDCLVGTWRTTEHTESADTEQGRLTITGVDRTLRISADGTETVTYGSRPATATTDKGRAQVTYAGTVVYGVSTNGDRMSFELRTADGTITVAAEGAQPTSEALKPGTGAVTYTCDADTFVQEAQGYRSVMERVS